MAACKVFPFTTLCVHDQLMMAVNIAVEPACACSLYSPCQRCHRCQPHSQAMLLYPYQYRLQRNSDTRPNASACMARRPASTLWPCIRPPLVMELDHIQGNASTVNRYL